MKCSVNKLASQLGKHFQQVRELVSEEISESEVIQSTNEFVNQSYVS